MLAPFNSAGWQSNATRLLYLFKLYFYTLYIKLVSLFTVTVDRVPRAPLDVSRLAASAVEAPLEKRKTF